MEERGKRGGSNPLDAKAMSRRSGKSITGPILLICATLVLFGVLGVVIRSAVLERRTRADAGFLLATLPDELGPSGRMDDLTRISMIRDWIYQQTDAAATRKHLLKDSDHSLRSMGMRDLFRSMEHDTGGHWCSGVAYILERVLLALGYQAYVYDYGDPESLTHSVTLVRVNGQLYLQDAYFNLTYGDGSGTPLPFIEMLARLAHGGQPQKLRGKHRWRDVHFESFSQANEWRWNPYIEWGSCRQPSIDHVVCKANMDTAFENHSLVPETLDFLSRHARPRDLDQLMLFPLGVTNLDGYLLDRGPSDILREVRRHRNRG
jgi:hypothetical protein